MPNAVLLALTLLAQAASPGGSADWIDVPFERQTAGGCGAACISMLLKYWHPDTGRQPDTSSILAELFDHDSNGIPAPSVERYLRAQGFRTYVFRGTWTDLQDQVSKGRPLIVSLRGGDSGQAHYVIVAGVDTARRLVMVNDPLRGKLAKMHRSDFEARWRNCDSWTLLAVPGSGQ